MALNISKAAALITAAHRRCHRASPPQSQSVITVLTAGTATEVRASKCAACPGSAAVMCCGISLPRGPQLFRVCASAHALQAPFVGATTSRPRCCASALARAPTAPPRAAVLPCIIVSVFRRSFGAAAAASRVAEPPASLQQIFSTSGFACFHVLLPLLPSSRASASGRPTRHCLPHGVVHGQREKRRRVVCCCRWRLARSPVAVYCMRCSTRL